MEETKMIRIENQSTMVILGFIYRIVVQMLNCPSMVLCSVRHTHSSMLIFTIPLGLRRHPLEGFLKNKVFDLAPRYWQTPRLGFNTSGPMTQPG